MDTNILLESGTNELELLEFEVGNSCYGINISKVVEIMINQEVTPVPNAPEEVEGVFIPRDKLISVVDLHKVLNTQCTKTDKDIFIICEFNQMQVAFHVSKVKGIQRISWSDISDPPSIANGSNSEAAGLSTGVAKVNGRIIIILDFEKIVSKLNRSAGLDTTGIDRLTRPDAVAGNKRIVVADDSVITLEVESRNHNYLVAADGRSIKCGEGQTLTIRRSPYDAHIVKPKDSTYFSTLRAKMMWGADMRMKNE